ncbi:hypothetical protein AHAS_Ahas13G0153600 [Arachis hypogaea]
MANGESGVVAAIFSEDELSEVSGVKRVGDYVEITCGCTSHRYGDAVGRLRVFVNGYLEITCECTPGCQEDKLSPSAFEKHSGRETARKWKNNIWVIVKGEKVPLFKTVLLKYYNQVSKAAALKSQSGRSHRDEFVRCTVCNKERRFRLRSKEECRVHHDALADANWKCSDLQYDNLIVSSILYMINSSLDGGVSPNLLLLSELHVMMKKNEGAAEYTGDALALRHAKVAPPVSASAAASAAFQIAAARLVLTSQAMSKFDIHPSSSYRLVYAYINIFNFLIGLNFQSEFINHCSH